MRRLLAVVLLVCIVAGVTRAEPTGSWKLTLPSRQPITMLVAFSKADGKWVGDVIDITAKLPKEPKFSEVTVNGDALQFKLVVSPETTLSFEGIVAKDGKSLKGSLTAGGDAIRTFELTPSKLKTLQDTFELAREGLMQTEDADMAYENAREVLRQAAAKKLPPDEARAILDRVGKLAANHGRRWERHTTLKLADLLANQEGYTEVALAQARKAERMLQDSDEPAVRMATLDCLVRSLLAAKKAEDAKPFQAQLAKLEALEYQEWAKTNPPYKVAEYKGRTAKGDRVVVVELFSSTDFEGSAAIDLARDGLLKMFKPSEMIVLTYHLEDALGMPEMKDRMKSYAELINRGQHGLVAGKPSVGLARETTAKDAEVYYNTLSKRVSDELELPPKAKLTLAITPEKDGFNAKATVADLEKPGEKTMLRFALVEDRIRYPAGNGTKYHQMVVRAMPGGAAGFPLKAATGEQVVTIKPEEIKAALAKYLGDMAKDAEPLPVDRLAALKNLKLVAFIQNDATGDILTAAVVDLK